MNVAEKEQNRDHLKLCTENDMDRLRKMRKDDDFREFHSVIDYMLKNGVKLEQEVLD